MKLPGALVRLLYRALYLPAGSTPYFHLRGYMARHWVLGDRSPERNVDNPHWHGRRGGWLYRELTRRLAVRAHTILRSDIDRALHDHPWWSLSVVLTGGYWEVREPNAACRYQPETYALLLRELPGLSTRKAIAIETARRFNIHWRAPGSVVLRRARTAHRLVLPQCNGARRAPIPARTLFVMGRKTNAWGFFPNSFDLRAKVPWREYLGLDTQDKSPSTYNTRGNRD